MLDPMLSPHVHQSAKVSTNAEQKSSNVVDGEAKGIDFEDLLDVVNPLQHIPIVANIYQQQVQDEISDEAKAVGDIFYGVLTGGVFGVLSAVGNAVLKQQTDKDASEHLFAFFDHENSPESLTESQLGNSHSEPEVEQHELSQSQKDDYWSIRMKQIFGDDDLG